MKQIKKASILLLEDDDSLGFIIKDNLEMNNYQVMLAKTASEALQNLKTHTFDAGILDINLPDKDGFSVAAHITEYYPDLHFMFLTARNLKEDKLRGFKIGCDDYLVKPFSIEELQMRLEVILRRKQGLLRNNDKYTLGNYIFDYKEQLLILEKQSQRITKREADVLKLLTQKKGQLIQRSEILIQIWGEDDYFKGRSLDVFISKIRKYLSADPRINIINIHNSGFCLQINN